MFNLCDHGYIANVFLRLLFTEQFIAEEVQKYHIITTFHKCASNRQSDVCGKLEWMHHSVATEAV